jgi:6-phosphogluconolactonase
MDGATVNLPPVSLTRRALVAGAAGLTGLGRAQSSSPAIALVGCYTTAERHARGDGIHVYRVHPETGEWTHLQRLAELVNPSFLVLSRDQKFLYSAHGDETYVTSFQVDRAAGQIQVLNRVESGGRNGVHLAIAPAGRFLVVANYATGSVSVLPVRADGSVGEVAEVVALSGQPGPHRVEQTSSHPHQIVFDPSGKFVAVPDKGLDRVFVFAFDAASGKLTPTAQGSAVARAGSAPRHLAFHPRLPILWVLNELGSSVTTYQWDAERGHLQAVQILPTVPEDYTGENSGAEIALSGRIVYCSNRGHNSIAAFAIDGRTGLLKPAGWTSTRGRTPRFFTFEPSGRVLYAANEQSDTIVGFRVEAETGKLTPFGPAISNASPVSIVFVP